MEDYLQIIREDFATGKLLMDCIMPDAFEYLVKVGAIDSVAWIGHWLEATSYRLKQVESSPRTIEDLLTADRIGNKEKERIEYQRKVTIAKKMAVYAYVRDTHKALTT